jgi:adenylate cyclase class 2
MNIPGTEIEIKYLVHDLKKVEKRLQDMEAHLIQARQFERNLRFDLPDESLKKTFRVLRLRQDENVVLTYKGPGTKSADGIRAREEWEVTVNDFAVMQKIIESLGYVILFIYEKYRTTYATENAQIMLDELPFGFFVEIEGKTQEDIFTLVDRLQFNRAAAIPESYQVHFDSLKTAFGLSFRDLTFENFSGINVPESALGVKFSD